MPIEHIVDEKTGFLHVRRWGEISTHDEEAALRKRREDPLVTPGIPAIVDCREVNPADTTEVVKYLACKVNELAVEIDCGPVAIVVSTDVEYGMARMYMSMTELKHPNTEVFRSYNNALKWLRKLSEKPEYNSANS